MSLDHKHFDLLRQLYGESDGSWLIGYENGYRKQHGKEAWTKAVEVHGMPYEVHPAEHPTKDVL